MALEESKPLCLVDRENKIIEKGFYIFAGFDDYPLATRIAPERASAEREILSRFLVLSVSTGTLAFFGENGSKRRGDLSPQGIIL
jgi:hypothetical protein